MQQSVDSPAVVDVSYSFVSVVTFYLFYPVSFCYLFVFVFVFVFHFLFCYRFVYFVMDLLFHFDLTSLEVLVVKRFDVT
jgi:hypothetical protein